MMEFLILLQEEEPMEYITTMESLQLMEVTGLFYGKKMQLMNFSQGLFLLTSQMTVLKMFLLQEDMLN